MGENRQQKQAKERAAKVAKQTTEAPVPAPQLAPPATPTPAVQQPSKQQQTVEKLKAAWTARGVDLSKMTTKQDGKFLLITVGEGWPVVQIGATGGISLPAIRSYPKAFEAAVEGDKLLAKQSERDARKAAAAQPAPAKQSATA